MIEIIIIVLLVLAILVGLANFFKKPAKDSQTKNMLNELLTVQKDGQLRAQSLDHNINQTLTQTLGQTRQELTTKQDQSTATINKRFHELNEEINLKLGEMQGIGQTLGDLGRVLSGTKTRGLLGEYELDLILRQMLTPSQYQTQVAIKEHNAVDFAVKLPGKDGNQPVLLPIDSKFPMEDYERLLKAQEASEPTEVELARKSLMTAVLREAKSIAEKYIFPPKTTDFAILFLPTESLFIEVINDAVTFQRLNDLKISVVGPSTLTAVLNSLLMGFKTLQIEQTSSEIQQLLEDFKREFDKYDKATQKVLADLTKTNKDVEDLIGTRTNVLKRQLAKIEADRDNSENLFELN